MLFEFIKSLIPNVKKSSVEDDLKNAEKTYAESALPMAEQTEEALRLHSKKSKLFLKFNGIFYAATNIRRSDYFPKDLLVLLKNAQENLLFLKDFIRKNLEDNTFTDVIDASKAQLIRSASGLSNIASAAVVSFNDLLREQSSVLDSSQAMSTAEMEESEKNFKRLCSLLESFGRPHATFKKNLLAVPEARLTPSNLNEVQSMHLKDIDPFAGAEANGFVPHPVLLVREQWANFLIWRYERNKSLKKTFELRILMLRAQLNKENTAAIEKQIEYYENEVAKFSDKISTFEKKWG